MDENDLYDLYLDIENNSLSLYIHEFIYQNLEKIKDQMKLNVHYDHSTQTFILSNLIVL